MSAYTNYQLDPQQIRDLIDHVSKGGKSIAIICGPTASGKSTLRKVIVAVHPEFKNRIFTSNAVDDIKLDDLAELVFPPGSDFSDSISRICTEEELLKIHMPIRVNPMLPLAADDLTYEVKRILNNGKYNFFNQERTKSEQC